MCWKRWSQALQFIAKPVGWRQEGICNFHKLIKSPLGVNAGDRSAAIGIVAIANTIYYLGTPTACHAETVESSIGAELDHHVNGRVITPAELGWEAGLGQRPGGE
ncbi:MAG: hypothetical protein ABS58_11545 [Mesorhizobium sp. SCN 65-20]|nr:MAG: hypothetical protein ABS58_11545 [Mesorhizobium sp. SCN 65-20]